MIRTISRYTVEHFRVCDTDPSITVERHDNGDIVRVRVGDEVVIGLRGPQVAALILALQEASAHR